MAIPDHGELGASMLWAKLGWLTSTIGGSERLVTVWVFTGFGHVLSSSSRVLRRNTFTWIVCNRQPASEDEQTRHAKTLARAPARAATLGTSTLYKFHSWVSLFLSPGIVKVKGYM